jgi:hypothetical protein
MQNRHAEFEQYLKKALPTSTSPRGRRLEKRLAVETTLSEIALPQDTNANRVLEASARASCARQPSRWFSPAISKSASKPVATTSLCGLLAQWRSANWCETIIWLTVAAAALAVLVLSLTLAA